jgi:hypothetical protein
VTPIKPKTAKNTKKRPFLTSFFDPFWGSFDENPHDDWGEASKRGRKTHVF